MIRLFIALFFTTIIVGCSGSPDNPVKIPSEQLQKIDAAAKVKVIALGWERLELELYNGTDYQLSYFDLELLNRKNGRTRQFRVVYEPYDSVRKMPVPKAIAALSTNGNLSTTIGDFLNGATGDNEWSWRIVDAYGFK